MFLKQIKIVGFKSFVEPTVLHFNSDRVAVVGPNGCGKSNVIDAIRWVMGESSPKFLRGDLMADVIFNGSLHRKPLGMASVEILLDNSKKILQGAYISQGEIALRREVNRSGDSNYFINGQRVRRKDLTDLWLGTGAGSRGYAIIGQNMVNQLVEANPEALKSYLEEAAGVSKYKERRKESAERLIKVEENISRITDILFELSQQLERLEIEARDAQTYQNLRQELRKVQDQQRLAKAKNNYFQQQALSQKLSVQSKDENTVLLLIQEVEKNLNELHQKNHQLANELRQDEQSLLRLDMACEQYEQQHLKHLEVKERYLKELDSLNQEKMIVLKQKEDEEQLCHKLLQNMAIEKKDLEQLELEKKQYEKQLKSQQALFQQQYQIRQDVNQKIAEYNTQMKILMAKNEQSKVALQDSYSNCEHYHEQINQSKLNYLLEKKKCLEETIHPLQEKLNVEHEKLSFLNQDHQVQMEQLRSIEIQMHNAKQKMEKNRQNVLEKEAAYKGLLNRFQLENECFDKGWKESCSWLETWVIPNEWQKVIDNLWQSYLPDYVSDDRTFFDESLSSGYYAKLEPVDTSYRLPLKRLVDMMNLSFIPAGILDWSKIYIVDSGSQAYFFQKQLQANESILSLDGVWMGLDWVEIMDLNTSTETGLATTLNQLNLAKQNLIIVENEYQKSLDIFISAKNQFDDLDSKRHQKQIELNNIQSELQQYLQQEQQLSYQIQLEEQVLERLRMELDRMETQVAKLLTEQKNWQNEINHLNNNLKTQECLIQELVPKIDALQIQYRELESIYSKFTNLLEIKSVNMSKFKSEYEFVSVNIPKTTQRLNLVIERIEAIDELLQKEAKENFSQERFLEQKNEIKKQIDLLEKKKQTIEQVSVQILSQENELNHLKKKQLNIMEQKWRLLSEIEQTELAINEFKQIYKDEWSDKVGEDIPSQDENFYKKLISDLENQLLVLGDVNLLAVNLFEQEKNRYVELSSQQEDLKKAILELESAIATLDHDMQVSLEETLRLINEHLLVIFPQLFGGGEAKFVASCDNLLEATVSMHVQAPGKKQHRIQLLSGGEKALTAVALLFSIFSLNPSPFCLLDEVDAALDDANVQRLSKLIKTLSNSVQFVLITHNPLTMDVAEELIGVTMQEPGVSRVVSVNMAKALEMINKE